MSNSVTCIAILKLVTSPSLLLRSCARSSNRQHSLLMIQLVQVLLVVLLVFTSAHTHTHTHTNIRTYQSPTKTFAFAFSPAATHTRSTIIRSSTTFRSTSIGDSGTNTAAAVKSEISSSTSDLSKENAQEVFIHQMKDWRGSSRSTSEFVTHFIASSGNITIEEAVLSVLPTEVGIGNDIGTDNNIGTDTDTDADADTDNLTSTGIGSEHQSEESMKRKKAILEREKDKIFSRLEMNFRHDPSQFPLNNNKNPQHHQHQLSPIDLIAMGSVWFLPVNAPRDPALGLKPIRLEAKNLTSIMTEGDYLRVHYCPRRFPKVHAFDWGKHLDEHGSMQSQDGSNAFQSESELPGVIVHQDLEKGYIVLNKPAGVPVHPTVDNVLENVAGAIGRAIVKTQWSSLEERVDTMHMYESSSNKHKHHKHNQRNQHNQHNQHQHNNGTIAVQNVNQTLTSRRKNKKKVVKRRRNKEAPLLYVVAPQRLDQNTSGLFVIATKKIFAGYFAKLLRTKTGAQLKAAAGINSSSSNSTQFTSSAVAVSTAANLGNIQKKYRCLVCIQPDKRNIEEVLLPPSIWDEFNRLQSIVKSNEIVRHYLEPTKRAPRIYSEDFKEDWLECLMKIINVGEPVMVVGSTAADKLCEKLWGFKANKPVECTAVMQVEVEILTGRAHQIRGQLSSLGFSLCGDAMYGGTAPIEPLLEGEPEIKSLQEGNINDCMTPDKLALHCCELQFLDPDYVKNKKGNEEAIRSNRVNKFRLQKAWWSPYLEQYATENNSRNTATTSKADLEIAKEMRESEANLDTIDLDEVKLAEDIRRIQLSPGIHKYVIIKATHPSLEQPEWFVKSASPEECGGPFHADVARVLVSDLNAAGFDTVVLGGGRIKFDFTENHAHVYGYSYGFGKGDHEFASLLIERMDITSSFDNSDALY